MSIYLQEAHNILQMTLIQLKTIRYTQYTRNRIRTLQTLRYKGLKLQNDQQDDQFLLLKYRNLCYAFHSKIQQELYDNPQTITTQGQLKYALKHNEWVK